MNRGRHAAAVVHREVLAKQRRALLIFGDMHLIRGGRAIVARLEGEADARVFNIATVMGTDFESLGEVQADVLS